MSMLPQVGALALADTKRALAAVLEGGTVLAGLKGYTNLPACPDDPRSPLSS
jgi:hypothetical protein